MSTDNSDAFPVLDSTLSRAQSWIEAYQARKQLAGINVDPSSNSQVVYWRRFERMIADSARTGLSVAACAALGVAQSEWYFRRAAFFWCAYKELARLLDAMRRSTIKVRIRTDDDPNPTQPDSERDRGYPQIAALLCGCESFEAMSAPGRARRYSTRSRIIRGLPSDWREQIFTCLPHWLRTPFLVLALTGCRPIELQRGVWVALTQRDGRELLMFEIEGAKVTARTGQPVRHLWREIHLCPLATLLYNQLYDSIEMGEPRIRVSIACGRSVSDAVTRYGAKLWPSHGRLNAYALRYQFKEDLRAAGLDREFIARAMGHCNDVSQNYYGGRRRTNPSGSASSPQTYAGFMHAQASRRVRQRVLERELIRELTWNEPERTRELTWDGPERTRELTPDGPERTRELTPDGPERTRELTPDGPERSLDLPWIH